MPSLSTSNSWIQKSKSLKLLSNSNFRLLLINWSMTLLSGKPFHRMTSNHLKRDVMKTSKNWSRAAKIGTRANKGGKTHHNYLRTRLESKRVKGIIILSWISFKVSVEAIWLVRCFSLISKILGKMKWWMKVRKQMNYRAIN